MTDETAERRSSPQEQAAGGKRRRLRRPDDEITNRPRLKVKPVGNRTGDKRQGPKLRRGTPAAPRGEPPADSSAEEKTEQDKPAKVVLRPRQGTEENRYPYATYREAPQDEAEEEQELAAVSGETAAPEISTGFLLGLALIGVVLVGGILIARLGNKVASLERRVAAMEQQATPQTAQMPREPQGAIAEP
jgi:hypothetical protein